jgi:hypothetical protein
MRWCVGGVITASLFKANFFDLRSEPTVTPACTLAPIKQHQSSVETLEQPGSGKVRNTDSLKSMFINKILDCNKPAKRRLPGPGKTKVTSAGGSRLSPRSGRQTRPGGVEGAPAGRTGAGVNRPTVRPRRLQRHYHTHRGGAETRS